MKNKKGFTLIEVLVVIVILGVLAAAAVPIYTSRVKSSYRAEALNQLTAIRSAMADFQSTNATYTGAAFGTPLSATAIGYVDPASQTGGQTQHFTYAITVASAATYTITATGVAVAPLAITDTVIINQAGTISGSLT